jgi:signal transduction histidine kinase
MSLPAFQKTFLSLFVFMFSSLPAFPCRISGLTIKLILYIALSDLLLLTLRLRHLILFKLDGGTDIIRLVSLRRIIMGVPCLVFLLLFSLEICFAENTVVVGIYENSPKVFIDENGEPAGIFVDIIREIASKEGWQLEYRLGSWSEGLDRLESGEIDLMPDVAFSTTREDIFDFHSEPVLSDWFHVYAREGSGIRSVVDLQNKRIAVLERSIQQEAFMSLADEFSLQTELVPLPDYDSIFQMVADGEVDAAVTNRFYGIAHADEYRLEDTAVIFNPTELFFASAQGANAELLEAIDRNLIIMKQNPGSIYYTSLQKWTSEKYSFQFAGWARNTICILGGVLFLSLLGSYLLKKQVNSRTNELLKINREMEARIQDRTVELAEAMEAAKSADQLKSVFLAAMSHELRTPLNSIIGFTGILVQEMPGPVNPEQRKQLKMIQNSARHLLALINDVLDISKIEAGELDLSYTSFDLSSSIREIVDLIRPMAEKKNLAVVVHLPEEPVQVNLDKRRLEQIVLNLVNNAVKFTETGSVDISLVCRGENCSLSVEDTGIGIPPASINMLFNPFQQLDSGLNRKHEGTGLGLSICRKLIEMMNGTIGVESKPGSGSVFSICFNKNPEVPGK